MVLNSIPRKLNGAGISKALSALNQHMRLYGYELLELPVIDDADLFLIKAGDQIINQMFTFDRQNKQLALRPEFTASATHHYIRTNSSTVARWQFAGPIFEDTSAEYEQLGFGAELIGLAGSLADAEIVAMSALGLDTLGVSNWNISIGHIGLVRELLVQFNLDIRTQRYLLHNISALHDSDKGKQWLVNQFDKQNSKLGDALPTRITYSDQVATMGGRTYDDIMKRMELKKRRIADRGNFLAAVEFMEKWSHIVGVPSSTFDLLLQSIPSSNSIAIAIVNSWKAVVSLLAIHGIPESRITINPSLIRSWEYYTGFVFELYAGESHIGGGGRYDELGRLIGSTHDIPAVGFAYYGDKLLNALPSSYFESAQTLSLQGSDQDMPVCAKWANLIRSYGISVQILPSLGASSTQMNAVIVEGNALEYGERIFQFDQIEQFISELKSNVYKK